MRRKSPLSNKRKLLSACRNSESIKGVLDHFGLRAAGGNYNQVRYYCSLYGIAVPKMNPSNKTKAAIASQRVPNDLIFCAGSSYSNRHNIKKRLHKMGFEQRCSSCSLGPSWNGKPLTLQLDHINGIYNDHRLENLRLLCPNCHSQTDNFSGRTSYK